MHERAKELIEILTQDCENMEDLQALIKSLFKGTIERMLEAEMDVHLSYEKDSILGINSAAR